MEKIKELRMTMVILLVGVFFISGCFFNDDKTITFKTNGGSEIKNITVKSGSKLDDAPIPVKDGYIFEGWYLDGKEYSFDDKVLEDITLVAKWIKESFDDSNVANDEKTTTTTTTTTKKSGTKTEAIGDAQLSTKTTKKKATTKKTTKKSTTAKKTTTSTTVRTATTTTTVPPTTTSVTTTVTTTKPLVPDIDVPEIKPPEVVTVPIDIKIEIVKNNKQDENLKNDESVLDENKSIKKEDELGDKDSDDDSEYIKITRTDKDVNVISKIDLEDLTKLLKSDSSKWTIISNHGYVYTLAIESDTIFLKGDNDVSSFTVVNDGTSFIFDYDADDEVWIIKYPTVSVGVGLDCVFYKDLETAILVAKANDTITLLANQQLEESLLIKVPVKIEGDKHLITNKNGFVFNLEEIVFEADDEFIVNNLVVDVDSLIFVGKSNFKNIVLNNVTGSIRGIKIDKKEDGEFQNTSLLQQF